MLLLILKQPKICGRKWPLTEYMWKLNINKTYEQFKADCCRQREKISC